LPTRCGAGIDTAIDADNTLLAHAGTTERVGDVAFAAGVAVHELSAERSSLEEIFLELTAEPAG
jgi:ABC-2 type transport system ATP-binding protein